jgi:ubiquinone/menaquinone biosynthesis C-methylase UbiE
VVVRSDSAGGTKAVTTGLRRRNIGFAVVTCSHAMYELTGKTRRQALQEIKRCLKPSGRFCMMEHEKPKQLFIRLLYHIRLLSMGKEGRRIVRQELEELKGIFRHVFKEVTASGRTKLICGEKAG